MQAQHYADEGRDIDIYQTYQLEREMPNLVRNGDVRQLEMLVSRIPAGKPGQIAPDTLRQEKNIFIVTTTQASRIHGYSVCSEPAQKVASYFRHHLYEPICAGDLALGAVFQRSHLFTRFKKGAGCEFGRLYPAGKGQ